MMKLISVFFSLLLLTGCQAESGSDTEAKPALRAETAKITGSASGKPVASDKPIPDASTGMELQGQFSYMADAALFRDCSTGKVFPVDMSEQYMELERTYLNSGIESGAALRVELRGRYLERPGMEENSHEIKLIVDELYRISESQDCTPEHHAELLNTYWKLLSLGGNRVQGAENQHEAHFVLHGDENRVNGHGGCNSFFGSYSLKGDEIGFSGIGSTMMACVAGMETEQAFLLALAEANRVAVEDQFLELYKDDSQLARFEAVYF